MGYVVRGVAGRICWGHYRAATLGAWTVDGQTLIAIVTDVDTFRVQRQPLEFVVPQQGRWSIESLEIADRTVTARLSPQRG